MTTTLEREHQRKRYFTTLTPDQASAIYRRAKSGESSFTLAAEFNVSRTTIRSIRTKFLWRSLTDAIDAEQLAD